MIYDVITMLIVYNVSTLTHLIERSVGFMLPVKTMQVFIS